MNKILKVGTRKSALAVEQSNIAVRCMEAATPGTRFELVYKMTEGDRILDRPLLSFGGKGVFVSEFEEALQTGEIDFAVHSAKDLPMSLAEGLAIVGAPKREDPRDVLIVPKGICLKDYKSIVIGTSSLRRQVQIEGMAPKLWPGIPVRCENLRGNVQTRLGKLDKGEYDAIILAAAGLKRLGIDETEDYQFHYFDCEEFLPAGGQGILAIEGRIGDPICRIAEAANDDETVFCLFFERKILKLLNAGCHEPVGVYARVEGDQVILSALYQHGEKLKIIKKQFHISQAEKMAEEAARELLDAK